MVTRPELAGIEALKQQALQKNRMMNPEERDRIGSLGKPKTLLDLYNEYQADQKVNPEQTYGMDAIFGTAGRYTETPGTDGSLLGRMQPEGDNLQEEFENMSPQLFQNLLVGNPAIGIDPSFGEEGQKKLDKIRGTGAEYRVQDAYNERMDLIDEFKEEVLGPYGSIDSLLKAQRLRETERQEAGQRFATPDLKSLFSGIFISDKIQTGVPFYTDESSPIDMPAYRQQIEKDFGKTQGELVLAEDSTLYTKYDSREKALADSDFLSRAKEVKNTTDFYSAGMQMNVAGVLRLEGQSREDGFYVPIVTLDEEQKAFVTNIISREDDLNIAGQALGLAEIAATPVQGLYKGVFMAFGKSIDIAFNEAGKLTTQSLKALEKLGTSPAKIKQLENNAKLRIMYSKSKKESITKPAPKPKQTTAKTEMEESVMPKALFGISKESRAAGTHSYPVNWQGRMAGESERIAAVQEKINTGMLPKDVWKNFPDLFPPRIKTLKSAEGWARKNTDLVGMNRLKDEGFTLSGNTHTQKLSANWGNAQVDGIKIALSENLDANFLVWDSIRTNLMGSKNKGRMPTVQKDKSTGSINSVNHGNTFTTMSNLDPFIIYRDGYQTPIRDSIILERRNYIKKLLMKDENFVKYANRVEFNGNVDKALDSIFKEINKANKASGGKAVWAGYRTENVFPDVDIIHKKFKDKMHGGDHDDDKIKDMKKKLLKN